MKTDSLIAPPSADDATRAGRGELGLAIGHDLARGMGGDLIVDRWLGAGSTFTVRLSRTVTPAESDAITVAWASRRGPWAS